ncbi:MAG: alcohol dehydrogenase catalytic domain-containing protein [Clostridia bacterium]|nr:alcohol dehydrogenase catalytic domain-containing protein [Clostridia bacterium]
MGKDSIEVVEAPIPEPKEGEILVKLKASALCRSDLHKYHGEKIFDEEQSNITPGHEPCGVVEKLGENVNKVKVGARVALYLGLGCGVCEHCLSGNVILCSQFKCIGFQAEGAHADYMVIPQENCLLLPDKMSFVTGALSTDVGGTLYTACKRLDVNGTKTVAIFGVGPMGCGGVLMAKGYGASVIAIDIDDQRLQLAKELGADYTINAKDINSVNEIYRLTDDIGADVSIVCAGGNALNDALNCTKKQGEVGIIAESNSCDINPSDQFLRKLMTLKGCWYFNRSDWEEISSFIVKNNIQLEKISTHTFNIKDAEEAFRLFDGRETQKVVFVWDQ